MGSHDSVDHAEVLPGQVDLKKHEASNQTVEKKCLGLEKQIANLTTKIEMEMEARGVAEQEKRDAEAQSNLLKKQNKVLESARACSSFFSRYRKQLNFGL